MARFAIIQGGQVANIVEADSAFAADQGWIDPQGASIGWLYDGSNFTPPLILPAPVPQSISPRQIRQALTLAGLRNAVETAVALGPQNTKDWYEWSTAFERNNPQVISMGVALGVTDKQLDELWTLGSTL